MYNQHTIGMLTTRHRSLVERGGRKALLETLHTHTKEKIQEKPIFTNLKKRFEHIELPAKLLDYFLRSNKSNINQLIQLNPRAFGGVPGTRISFLFFVFCCYAATQPALQLHQECIQVVRSGDHY